MLVTAGIPLLDALAMLGAQARDRRFKALLQTLATDVENGQPYPVDRKMAFWSHGGITPAIMGQIEEFLSAPVERMVATAEETERMAQ